MKQEKRTTASNSNNMQLSLQEKSRVIQAHKEQQAIDNAETPLTSDIPSSADAPLPSKEVQEAVDTKTKTQKNESFSSLVLPPKRDVEAVAISRDFSKYQDIEDEVFDTTLEENITFTGSISFSKPFKICGKVKGCITATSDLLVDTTAQVAANISATRVFIKGAVRGDINAAEFVFVSSTGSLVGDVIAQSIILEPGSVFEGRSTMCTRSNS